jgi:hypothetical protein
MDTLPCSRLSDERIAPIFRLENQAKGVIKSKQQRVIFWLLGFLFYPEYGGYASLRNVVKLLPDYTA